jgi:hypothetical protein
MLLEGCHCSYLDLLEFRFHYIIQYGKTHIPTGRHFREHRVLMIRVILPRRNASDPFPNP